MELDGEEEQIAPERSGTRRSKVMEDEDEDEDEEEKPKRKSWRQ